MAKTLRFSLMPVLALILVACTLTSTPTVQPPVIDPESVPALTLTMQAQNGADTFNAVGQVIQYLYIVANTSQSTLAGPVVVNDDKTGVLCPEVNTIGDLDGELDPGEAVTCSSSYSITQADLDAGAVTSNATATVSGTNSNLMTVSVPMTQNRVLTLSKAANPTTFNKAGQTITYTYVILNNGNVTIQGPFSITDDKTPVTCTEPDDGFLSPNEEMACTAAHIITQADLDAGSITNTATALGSGVSSSPVSTTISSGIVAPPVTTPANLTAGSTIQHQVSAGEWLIQIARCYGANIKETIAANPQISNPSKILPGITVTVPRIGSAGTIYGPPCVVLHTVLDSDTWNSIAQKYNADLIVLQHANPGALTVSRVLKVPINSAGGTAIPK